MAKGITVQVAARVPLSVVEFMDMDIGLNNFMNRAEWVQYACREFMKIRQKELSQDSSGGGGELKKMMIDGICRQFFSIHTAVVGLILLKFLDSCLFVPLPASVTADFLPMGILQ